MCRGQIDPELKEIYFNFFARFSRFEYCLKKHGFREPQKDWVKTSWECFSRRFSCAYSGSEYSILHKEEYLSTGSLLKLVKIHDQGNNDWKSITIKKGSSELTRMIYLLKTLRNNLFHGDKNSDQGIGGQRDKDLLLSGSRILDGMAELADSELTGFWDDYKIVT